MRCCFWGIKITIDSRDKSTDTDGSQVVRTIRKYGFTLPIVILSDRVTAQDRIAGLQAGADDYLTKPASLQELMLRLEILLRRMGLSEEPSQVILPKEINFSSSELRVGDVIIHRTHRTVKRAGSQLIEEKRIRTSRIVNGASQSGDE